MAITHSAALHEELAAMLHDIVGVDASTLQPDSDLRRDVGLDSLSLVELLIAVEHRFDVAVPDEMARVRTVGEAAGFIARLLGDHTLFADPWRRRMCNASRVSARVARIGC